jgi:ABC-2 type transport system permease protein
MSIANAQASVKRLPSDMNQVWTVTRIEFLRNLRRKRLLIFVIIIAMVSALVLAIPPLFAGYPSDPIFGPYTFLQFFTSVVNFLVVLLAVFYGGDMLVSEVHSRTGYAIFPNPIRRSSLFLGKFLASLLACILILGAYYVIAAVSAAVIYIKLPVELLYSFLFAILYASACLAVAFLISALMKTTTSATVLTFVLFLFIFNILSGMLTFAGVRAEPLLTFQSGVISGFVNGPYPEFFPKDLEISQGGFHMTIYQPTVEMGVAVTLIWLVVAFILAFIVFRRREMVE